jgi:hypothetical protein
MIIAVAILGASAVPATGQIHGWSLGFGDTGSEYGLSAAADVYGNVYVTGRFDDTVDFGSGPHISMGGSDIFLVKYDASGNCVWSKTFGNSGFDGGSGVGTDAAGNVYLTGNYHRTVDFGGGGITNAGYGAGWDTYDYFLAKYDSDGNHLWSYGYGGNEDDIAADLSVNDAGNVAIIGYLGWVASTTHWYDGFGAVFDASGTYQWGWGIAGTGDDKGLGIDIDNTGNVVMTGSFEETVNFGGGNVTASGAGGHPDIFLAKYNAVGAHQWSQRFGYVSPDEGTEVSVDNAGNIAVTGYFTSQVYFGGVWLFGAGFDDIFVAMFDAGGTYLWDRAFGNTGQDWGHSVDFDGAGNVIATGSFRVSADFGGGTLTSAGYTDIFLASYDATGSHLWSQRYGDANYEYPQSVCTGGSGEIWLTGNFNQTIDFGGGPLTATGSSGDGFVARFGVPQPAAGIVGVNDVPDDEGLWVTIDFIRSVHDDKFALRPIVSYDVYRAEPRGGIPTLVGTVTATKRNIYSIDVRTRSDNTLTSYRIHATTSTATYYNSAWASGYSVDNLAPAVPQNFVQTPPYLLTWDPAPEPDFDYYTLYGSEWSTFDGNAVLIATTANTSYDVQAHLHKYYHLSATDDAGNEGETAYTRRTIVGVGDVPALNALDLQVHPNPFNPATTITYAVPRAGAVTVSVYDVTGRLVDTLVDNAYREAQEYRMTYRPSAATGVYFVRVSAGGEAKTTRIVLLK